MDTAKKETEASDGKLQTGQPSSGLGKKGFRCLSSPSLSPQKLRAGCFGLLCSSPKQLSFSPIFWNPWPIVNSNSDTQTAPFCLPAVLTHGSRLMTTQQN